MTLRSIVPGWTRPTATVFELVAWLCLGFALSVLPVATAWANPRPVIDASERAEGDRLVAIVAPAGTFTVSEATPRGIALGLSDGAGHTDGLLRLDRVASDTMARFRSRHYAIQIESFSPAPDVTERLVRAANLVAASDGGGADNPHVSMPSPEADSMQQVTSMVLLLAAALCIYRRGKVIWELRLPHLIPAFIQVAVFTYWSLYWPGVRAELPVIVQEVVLGFALDAALSFARFGSWRIGASPLPVVLSINLFVWFSPDGILICIFTAFLSKTLLRRGGRHIFNPSATGLAVAGTLSYIFPEYINVGGLFHTLNLAPNMAEVLLLLALLPQSRFRILPVSIAAVVALLLTGNPVIMRPPILLAVALLATDPSTTPRTDIGKILFGAFLGFGLVIFSWEMRTHGKIDDFAKVMPIPFANLLVPAFDWVGTTVNQGARWCGQQVLRVVPAAEKAALTIFRPIPNPALMGIWLLLTVSILNVEKPLSFETALHWTYGTPLVVHDADDVPRCVHNPVFCQPFSFAREISAWRARRASRTHGRPSVNR
jgi:hypothetical protein